eukprot:TRINITY_DN5787_c0_g1_i1.p1 TRINITY_DN5787_c0_g1~~TRINITY_DN5787_c0_g1_i1.p1  ORF type:complete len:1968 (-),score=477.43 TRINITY_DN5787_c0_g1_i1:25-5928(-)
MEKGKDKADNGEPDVAPMDNDAGPSANKKPRINTDGLPVVPTLNVPQTPTTGAADKPLPFESPREEVLDDRLCILSHEQLELLVTRLARTDKTMEERIMRQIDRLEHSMSMYSPRRTEFTPRPFMMGASPLMARGMMSPMMMGMGMRGGDMFDDLGGEEVNVKAIRRKIRGAFQKLKDPLKRKRRRDEDAEPQKYKLATDTIRKEVKKGKDLVLLRNDKDRGLEVMEAITDEFITAGSELGEENVEQYDDALQELASDWVDLFLADAMNSLTSEERMDWVNKLFTWDKSANENEGTFSSARAAAKLGWSDTHLQQVLAGDHIGKYKEPEALSIVRCNMLERDRKVEQALHLAKAVELHHFTARFLIKLGRSEEALQTAKAIDDPAKVFSIAQVARSMDVKLAFALALQSIAQTYEWNQPNNERSLWLCDLAISQGMVDQLVTDADATVKHKTIQFEIAKILKDKTAFKPALGLAAIVLKEWPPSPTLLQQQAAEPKVPLTQQQLQQLQREEAARQIPTGVPKWMWDVGYEMLILETGTREDLDQVLDVILGDVSQVDQLLALATRIHIHQEFEQTIRVCKKCVELSTAAKERDLQEQTQLLTEYFWNILRRVQPPPQPPQRQMGYDFTFERNIVVASTMLLNAALDSKIPQELLPPQTTTKIMRPHSPIPQTTIAEAVSWCLSFMKDPTHRAQFAQLLKQRKEYALVLPTGVSVQGVLETLRQGTIDTATWKAQLAEIQREQAELLVKRKPLPAEKQEQLNELLLRNELQILVPYYELYSVDDIQNLQIGIAKLMINATIDNAIAEALLLRSSDAEVLEVALQLIVNNQYILNPTHRLDLLRAIKGRTPQHFPVGSVVRQLAPLILDYVNQLRADYVARQAVLVPFLILQQELSEITEQFLLKKRKDSVLPTEKQERYDKLSAIAATYTPLAYPANSVGDFDGLTHEIVSLMLSAALQTRQQIDERLSLSDGEIDEIIAVAIKNTSDPNNMRNLMKQIKDSISGRVGDFTYEFAHGYDLVVQLGQLALARIDELDEARKVRFEPHFEKKELDREASEQEGQKKTLTPEQQTRLEQLEEDDKLLRATNAKYVFSNKNVNEKLRLDVNTIMLSNAYSHKKTFENRVAAEPEAFTAEMIADGKARARAHIDRVVDIIDKNTHDPSHLLTLGNMLSENLDTMHVVRYVKRVLAIVDQLEAARKERNLWEAELSTLQEEEAELKSKRKPLEAAFLEKLNPLRKLNARKDILASFEKQTWGEHDDYKLSAAQLALGGLFRAQQTIDSALSATDTEDIPVVELTEQRETVVNLITWVIDDVIGKNIENPGHILSLAQTLLNYKEYARVMPMSLFACNRTMEIHKSREAKESIKQWIYLYTEEQQKLAVIKKDLPSAQQKKLDQAQQELDEFPEMPDYANSASFDQMEENIYTAAYLVLRSALGALQAIDQQIAAQPPDSQPILQDEREAAQKQVTEGLQFVISRVSNPQRLIQIADEMARLENYELVMPIALRCMTRQTELNTEYTERLEVQREAQRLQNLEAEMERNRKALPDKQKQRLRELLHQQRMFHTTMPQFCKIDPSQTDATSSNACSKRIDTVLQIKADAENKMVMDETIEGADADAHKDELAQRVQSIVEESIEFVHAPRNLHSIARKLYQRREYALVIIVGARCQKTIQVLVDQNEQRIDLTTKLQDLRQQLIVSPSDEVKVEIEKTERDLEQLPVQYEQTSRLNSLNLEMATMMIEAAKVEKRNDVLRDQAVLRFKISPTIPLFDEVKILTEADEWPEVKKELLEQILKPQQDDGSGGYNQQMIDPRAKMELLLNEGMWKQALPLFPEPPYGSMDMLERLLLDLERNAPDSFDQILPTVEKYAVYYYSQFQFNNAGLERVLDQTQRRAPDFVLGLFQRAIEKMLLNVLPKQYELIVNFLQMFKKRLVEDLGRDDDWESVLGDITKQHKGKRKLMQLINNSGLKD